MVVRTAKRAQEVDDVVVATDSDEVVQVAKRWNIDAIITSSSHQSGTDRVFEAAQKLTLDENEIIINLQADEPFIEPNVLQSLYNLTKAKRDSEAVLMCSCYKPIDHTKANDPNIVKVVTDKKNNALYFSRAVIPHDRSSANNNLKAHIGLYGYSYKKLRYYCKLSHSTLEQIEKLEQLRVLEAGYKIAMTQVQSEAIGIDTKEDLTKALKHFNL